MRICKTCGRKIANDSANFCEYCGASARDGYAAADYKEPVRTDASQTAGEFAAWGGQRREDSGTGSNERSAGGYRTGMGRSGEEKEPVIGFGNWMLTLLIPLIPMVGPFVYIVMLFVWAFGRTNPSKKNWARATLIMLIISMVMVGAMFGSLFSNLGMDMIGI